MVTESATLEETRQKVQARVMESYPAAKKETTDIALAIDRFLVGPVYYVEWEDEESEDENCFCYVLVHNEIEIYDDGVQLIQRMKQILDDRKTFSQHIKEFTFNEFIGALIAVGLTTVFGLITLITFLKAILPLTRSSWLSLCSSPGSISERVNRSRTQVGSAGGNGLLMVSFFGGTASRSTLRL